MAFDYTTFGNKLRGKRNERHMSQADLAKASGVSVAAITRYENGACTPGADKIWELSVALDCTPNDLFGVGKAS